jgi:putative endonuclease
MSGSLAYHSGLAAEDSVANLYERTGHAITAKRWRSAAGEIDLIVRKNDNVIFIEVKKSKTHDQAAQALRPAQIARIYNSAAMFLEGEPLGQNTDARFDVALVDATGAISILENAICA